VLVTTLVGLIRETQPHVVVTYDAFGNTGHPDHIQAHRVTMLAVGAASEAKCFPRNGTDLDSGAGLHPVYPLSALRQFLEEEQQAGRPHPFDGRDPNEINYARPDEDVTHRVDISEVYDHKTRALHVHRSRIGPHYPLLYQTALARRHDEHFRLAWQRESNADFDDIFEPVVR
jgi:N-acetyl-1-D-myo-inositol-2-amino-2-deoxy-alpha-D-glucopyranoside deacetylase